MLPPLPPPREECVEEEFAAQPELEAHLPQEQTAAKVVDTFFAKVSLFDR